MSSRYPDAADRYEAFRARVWAQALPVSARLAEPGGIAGTSGATETELEIQARWFGGEFGRTFTGTEGERIEVVQFGHWNRGTGPDFSEAAVRIDGELRAGPIELDLDARDWEGHGHGSNPDFDEVVLHAFTDGPSWKRFFTRTSRHRNVCQLQLPQYAWSQGPPDFLPEAFPGRCLAPLSRMEDGEVESLLLAAAQYRLHRKAERFRVMSGSIDREQALFQALAEALGYRGNVTAMAVLAQRCPLAELRVLDPVEREARLFGAAGFLDRERFEEAPDRGTRRYLRELWDRWWKMRDGVEPVPKRAIRWRFAGNRPLNHPQRRIGALAAVVGHWEELAPLWISPGKDVKMIVNNVVKNLDNEFWERHYTLRAAPSDRRFRLIGRDRLHDILGNVIFPGAIGVREDLWEAFLGLGAVDSNRKLRRAALRLFGPARDRRKLFTSCYYQQQGLLQIYHDFCLEDVSECASCPFPEQLAQWRVPGESRPRAVSA